VSPALIIFALAATDAAAFHPFTPTHYLTTGTYLTLMLALVLLGRALRNTPHQRTLERAWFSFVLIIQAFNIIFWSTPPRLQLASSLPLHICDLAGIFAVFTTLSWLRENRITDHSIARTLRTIMFFWGIGLSTQAFITPVITDGPSSVRFHIFFLSHFTIVATPLYDFLVRRYRPTARDLGIILLVTLVYGALIIPLNAATGWNYGYAGNTKPENPTLIDKLGPYPLRLLWMLFIVTGLYAILTLITAFIPSHPLTSPPTHPRTPPHPN